MSITTIINDARLSFDKNLFDANKKGKTGCNIIASDATRYVRREEGKSVPIKQSDLQSIVEEVLKQKFNGKVPAKFENWAVRKNVDSCSQTTGERFSGYEDNNGIYFAPGRYKGTATFVRKDGSIINLSVPAEEEEARKLFYAGCYCNFKVNFAAYETQEDGVTKRGVTTYLEAVQFLRHGEPFSGGSANADGFDAIEEAEVDPLS